ncbi:hypothetical protein [Cognatilysobacter bugurensis]|uniref:hypothetical protein n=1 Tax=Cognatilysobacter bugurensis TaxID=543356 RepID=UPI001679A92D|nr:hypothetical protein [Lysobacter bugurensis]
MGRIAGCIAFFGSYWLCKDKTPLLPAQALWGCTLLFGAAVAWGLMYLLARRS